MISDINWLERDGIVLRIDDMPEFNVKFQLALILGDNLGLNQIFGFIESFNSSYCCRKCKATLDQIQNMTVEDPTMFRTKKNYQKDVLKHVPSEPGIKHECVFHRVDRFHVLDNVSFDLMLGVLEGVCSYVMHAIVKHYVKNEYFSLDFLNLKISELSFGAEETYNKPPLTTAKRLKDHVTLKMSAYETLAFM